MHKKRVQEVGRKFSVLYMHTNVQFLNKLEGSISTILNRRRRQGEKKEDDHPTYRNTPPLLLPPAGGEDAAARARE